MAAVPIASQHVHSPCQVGGRVGACRASPAGMVRPRRQRESCPREPISLCDVFAQIARGISRNSVETMGARNPTWPPLRRVNAIQPPCPSNIPEGLDKLGVLWPAVIPLRVPTPGSAPQGRWPSNCRPASRSVIREGDESVVRSETLEPPELHALA